LSYGEFVKRVGQWAAWLADNGIGKGDRIAIAMTNTADHLALIVGCAAIGAVHYSIASGEIAANQATIDKFGIRTILADSPLVYSNCRILNLVEARPGRDYRQAELDVACHGDDPWKIVPSSGPTPKVSADPRQ
jgi:acyl-coenzyme A synthetase/AMP-(fatty) acid ligase